MATPPPHAPTRDNTLPILIGVGLFLLLVGPLMMAAMVLFGFGGHMGGRWWDWDADFMFFPFAGLLFIAYWAVAIALAVWVYRDAEARGMIGALWAVLVVFFTVPSIIVYLLLRSNPPTALLRNPPPPPPMGGGYYAPPSPPPATAAATRFCTQCGAAMQEGARYCGSCGNRM